LWKFVNYVRKKFYNIGPRVFSAAEEEKRRNDQSAGEQKFSLDASERNAADLEEAQQTAANLSPESASAEDEAQHAINFKVGNLFYSLLKWPILLVMFDIYWHCVGVELNLLFYLIKELYTLMIFDIYFYVTFSTLNHF